MNANGEWQTLGVTVEPDEIAVAKGAGKWTIGDFAGSCDQAGLNSPGLQSYAIDNKFPVGSLLTRVGKSVLGSGEVAAKIPAPGGELEARCNDRDYLNNHGELRVRVVAFKVP